MRPEIAASYSGTNEVAALERFADSDHWDRNVYTKALRKELATRTGLQWSVKGNHGTAWSWIDIAAPPKRLHGYQMTAEDESILSAVFGEQVGSQHISIPPTSGYRHSYLLRAAGLPTDTVKLAEHGWD